MWTVAAMVWFARLHFYCTKIALMYNKIGDSKTKSDMCVLKTLMSGGMLLNFYSENWKYKIEFHIFLPLIKHAIAFLNIPRISLLLQWRKCDTRFWSHVKYDFTGVGWGWGHFNVSRSHGAYLPIPHTLHWISAIPRPLKLGKSMRYGFLPHDQILVTLHGIPAVSWPLIDRTVSAHLQINHWLTLYHALLIYWIPTVSWPWFKFVGPSYQGHSPAWITFDHAQLYSHRFMASDCSSSSHTANKMLIGLGSNLVSQLIM